MAEEDRTVAAMWKIIAEYTRENNQRDVRLAEVSGEVRALQALTNDVASLLGRVDHIRRELDKLPKLGAEHVRTLDNLRELIQRRGVLDTFSESEMEQVRAALRRVSQWETTKAQVEDAITQFAQWRTTYDELIRSKTKEHTGLETAIGQVDALARSVQQDVIKMGAAMAEWEAFRREHLDKVKRYIATSEEGHEDSRSFRISMKTLIYSIVFTCLVTVPVSAVIAVLVHR